MIIYLQRHPEMDSELTKNGTQRFFTTTDDTADFDHYAKIFFEAEVMSKFADVKCGG